MIRLNEGCGAGWFIDMSVGQLRCFDLIGRIEKAISKSEMSKECCYCLSKLIRMSKLTRRIDLV